MPFLAPIGMAMIPGLTGTAASVAGGAALGGSVLSGVLKGKGAKSTATRTLSPQGQALESSLLRSVQGRIDNPGSASAPMRSAAIQRINRNFTAAPGAMQARFAADGFGRGGLLQKRMLDMDLARYGAIAGAENQFAAMDLDQRNRDEDFAARLLASMAGQQVQQTQPGGRLGGALDSGLETLGYFSTLGRLLK